MHPRNPYNTPPDFADLAKAFSPLKPWLIAKSDGTFTIDFRNETAQRHLTKALLYRDFDLTLTLPPGRLCPPVTASTPAVYLKPNLIAVDSQVPNRLNYVLWVQDIINAIQDSDQSGSMVHGIDIGTGASAIYPLLACKLQPEWEFTVTEIDETSMRSAQQNIEMNDLSNRITLFPAVQDGPVLSPLLLRSDITFDFTMCNPPFYGSAEEAANLAEAKQSVPNAVSTCFGTHFKADADLLDKVCTGADVEMITPGGECAFVCRMVRESLEHRSRCLWYTSMIGRMSSLFEIVALLRRHEVNNYAITEFVQGQTRRWGIAWSFTHLRLPDNIARTSSHSLHDIMVPRNNMRWQIDRTCSLQKLVEVLTAVLESIPGVSLREKVQKAYPLSFVVVVCATSDTWSRAARRRNKKAEVVATSSYSAMKCSITGGINTSRNGSGVDLEFQWIQGENRSLYESFYNHVGRKVDHGLPGASS